MQTLIELFEKSVARFPHNVLLWEKERDTYKGCSFSEVHQQVMRMGAGLMALGLQKGERAALLSEGQNAWLIAELGILYAGGVNVPLSIKLEAYTDIRFRIQHSGAKIIIVSRNQLPKIQEIHDELPSVTHIIYIDKTKRISDKRYINYYDLLQEGKTLLNNADSKAAFYNTWQSVEANDLANISYTSGTTADPKGIMLSHLNYTANVLQSNTLMDIDEHYRTLAILPWDHSFAHTACLYVFMVNGASIGSVQIGATGIETLKNVPNNIKELQPHVLMSVPALAKNFRKNIEGGIRKQGKMAVKLFKIALKIAYLHNADGKQAGKGLRLLLKPLLWLFDHLMFTKIRAAFGGQLQFFIGGGALLDTELQRFFYALGIPMCQGYGLSEASPVISSNVPHKIKFGSSGQLVRPMQLNILDNKQQPLPTGQQGEIVIKGDNVMLGYWQNAEATAEALRDGWLHTGDMGYMDTDGYLYVLGRFKSLLIGNDGEKYSPEGIEEAIVENSPLIDQLMLYNNQNAYTIGLVVPNISAIIRGLKTEGLDIGHTKGQERALMMLQTEIKSFFKGGKHENLFPERWLPTAIAVLPEAFSEDNKLINSTMKMVRNKINDYFAEDIKNAYSQAGKQVNNPRNINNISYWIEV